MENDETALAMFLDAVKLTGANLFIDALNKFIELSHQYPDSELADDALFNAGLCHFHLNSFPVAVNIFRAIIDNYPAADIYTYGNCREYGKTAAKCHYAIINCYLGMGQTENATAELKHLDRFPDSYIESGLGEKITFKELAQKAIATYSQFTAS